MSIYSTRKSKSQKMDRVARRGPLTRAPGALKGGDTSEIVNLFVAVEGGTLLKLSTFLSQLKSHFRKIFEKKSHNAEKQNGGPFGIFKHLFCCEISKKLKGDPLERKKLQKKSLTMPKNLKGGPFGVFQHPFCRKTSKN